MPTTHAAGRTWGGDPGPSFDWFPCLNSTTAANYQPEWEQEAKAIALSSPWKDLAWVVHTT